VRAHLDEARHVFDGALTPRGFLDAFPGNMIAAIAEGCGRMAFTRREALIAYAVSRRPRT
jgi:hypothetical protein